MKIKAKIQGKEVEIYSVMFLLDGKRYATIAKDIESITIEAENNDTVKQ